ncbi:MAG: hypothetical protein FWC67_04110 [Defluviitaleaceae bacterium]|nr:hypothetical protein [Defluviitaleaceae bacterium]
MHLYHYFEKAREPFLNLSDLSAEESALLHAKPTNENGSFAKRDHDGQYMAQRRIVEKRAQGLV